MADRPDDRATKLARELCQRADIVQMAENAAKLARILDRVTRPTPQMPDDPVKREIAWKVQDARNKQDIRDLLVLGWGITS